MDDPLEGSIFNIGTLQQLLKVSAGAPDILAQNSTIQNTIDLSFY